LGAATLLALDLREDREGVTVKLRVTPRASRDELVDFHNGALRVRLTAPPVEGQANAGLQRLLAKMLDVPRSSIELLRGQTGRDKLVRVRGWDTQRLDRALRALLRG
jgi:uncharacterized protein